MSQPVFYKLLTEDAQAPCRKSDSAVGYDISTNMEVRLPRGQVCRIGTGVCFNMTALENVYARLEPRSSTAVRRQICVIPGIIDNDYTGELILVAYYLGPEESTILEKGAQIAQVIFQNYLTPSGLLRTSHLPETVRGSGAFGSTDYSQCPPNQEHAAEEGYLSWPERGLCAYREWVVDPPLAAQQHHQQ